MSFDVPVAIIFFNRPDLLELCFARVRDARPRRLFLISDGPREHVAGESALVRRCREIVSKVDWQCDVTRNYADQNRGCREGPIAGFNNVLADADRGIFLEDDCIPHPDFFRFCKEMLDRYESDERIMSVSGVNFGPLAGDASSYYFSRYFRGWGWATWRRAWKHFDSLLAAWDASAAASLRDLLDDKRVADFWSGAFDRVKHDGLDAWDYQWTFAHLMNNGLSIIPSVNLVTNRGFRADGTHTRHRSRLGGQLATALPESLVHPRFVFRNARLDRLTEYRQFGVVRWRAALLGQIGRLLSPLRRG